MPIEPRRLLLFDAIVRTGSFSAAADELHLSQPSVSRHMAALERQCGLRLLDRTGRGIRLTAPGRAVADRVAGLRAELAAIDATVRAFASGETGEVRVAAFPTAAASLVAPALAALRRSHPDLDAQLLEAARPEALAMLRDGRVDVAVVFDALDDPPPGGTGFVHALLVDEPFRVALPATHPLASRGAVALAELSEDPWITGTGTGPPLIIERACRSAGFAPRVVARADDQPTIQALVAGGVGVTLIPQLAAAAGRRADIVLLALTPASVGRRVSAVTLAVTPRSPAVAALLDELVRLASEPAAASSA